MPSLFGSPSGRMPEKAPRWNLAETEACGSGKVFWWMLLLVWEYLGIYSARIRVGGHLAHRSWGITGINLYDDFSWTRKHPWGLERGPEEPRGSDEPRGAPPGLWAPRGASNPSSTSINTQIFPLHQSATRYTFFAAASFCSHKISSGGLLCYTIG